VFIIVDSRNPPLVTEQDGEVIRRQPAAENTDAAIAELVIGALPAASLAAIGTTLQAFAHGNAPAVARVRICLAPGLFAFRAHSANISAAVGAALKFVELAYRLAIRRLIDAKVRKGIANLPVGTTPAASAPAVRTALFVEAVGSQALTHHTGVATFAFAAQAFAAVVSAHLPFAGRFALLPLSAAARGEQESQPQEDRQTSHYVPPIG